jgi:hypothetical protein
MSAGNRIGGTAIWSNGGGALANVASSRARRLLQRDDEAGPMFAGPDCALGVNPNWQMKSKQRS